MKPLLLVTCSRSGSSLLTRILGKHGLWTGDCLGKDKTGYETYENEQVSSFIKNKWPNPSRIKPVPNSSVKFRSFILSIIPPKERAVFKTFVNMWPVWSSELPDADFIFSSRDITEMAVSFGSKRGEEPSYGHVTAVDAQIREAAKSKGLPVVNMSDVVRGDRELLRSEMSRLGIAMNDKTVAACIDRNMWH